MSYQQDNSSHDYLFEVIKTFTFNKESPALYILPALFLIPIAVLSSLLLSEILNSYAKEGELLISSMFISWISVMFLAYLISSSVASYKLLQLIKKHLYESSATTYYFTRGSDFQGLLQYLRNAMFSTDIPSPTTGVVLSILTGGISYPIVSCLAEKILREHMNLEERVLLGQEFTKKYRGLELLFQLALIILTMGIYLAYQTWKTINLYNKHVETIHGDHPNPPSIAPNTIAGDKSPPMSLGFFYGIVLLAMASYILLSSVGLFTTTLVTIGIGVLWSISAFLGKHRGARDLIITNITTAYLLVISGIFMGIFGFNTYSFYLTYYESLRPLVEQNPLYVFTYIFVNNAVISLPSIIPYTGLIPLSVGVLNAGLIIGLEIARRCTELGCVIRLATILIYPHTVLELLAYAIIASSVSKWGKWRELVRLLIIGLTTLLLAAGVEVVTVMFSR